MSDSISFVKVQLKEASPGYLVGLFEGSVQDIRKEAIEMSILLSNRWVEIAREEAPKKSGNFAESIVSEVFEEESEVGFKAYRAAPLGGWINHGTQAHEILPRSSNKKGVLSFFWENGPKGPGDYVFKKVNHPGAKPNEYYDRAMNRFEIDIRESTKLISDRFMISSIGFGSQFGESAGVI